MADQSMSHFNVCSKPSGFPIRIALNKIAARGKQEQLSDRLAEADAFVPPDPAPCLGHAH